MKRPEGFTLAGLAIWFLILLLLVNTSFGLVPPLTDLPLPVLLILVGVAVFYFVMLVFLLPAAPTPRTLNIQEYLLRIGVSAMLTIVAFALYFAQTGVDGESGLVMNALTATYFSMVTFSTLGYGDYAPAAGHPQLIAASEAIIGNIHLGLFVAAAFFLLQDSARNGGGDNGDDGDGGGGGDGDGDEGGDGGTPGPKPSEPDDSDLTQQVKAAQNPEAESAASGPSEPGSDPDNGDDARDKPDAAAV